MEGQVVDWVKNEEQWEMDKREWSRKEALEW